MGLTAPALKYILLKSKKYHFRGPLLTLGNQDIYATKTQLLAWLKLYSIKNPRIFSDLKSSSRDLQNINDQAKNFIHGQTFFNSIGINNSDYYDIDKFKFDKPKILHDLQNPLPKKFHRFFNFVVDSGTTEHIFDIKSVFKNIFNITKLGAHVLHIIPSNNFLNHGFYQLSPTVFYDFYTNNGFKVIESYIVEFRPNCYRFHIFNQKTFNNKFFINPYSRLCVLFLVKKVKYQNTFRNPDQYFYQHVTNSTPSKHFGTFTDKLRHLLPFKYHSYFYIPWVIYNQLFSKSRFFDINFD